MRALSAAAVTILLVGGCTSAQSGAPQPAGSTAASSAASGSAAAAPTADLTAALAVIPAGTTQVTFTDQAAAKARWGSQGVNSTTDRDSAEFAAYLKKAMRSPVIGKLGPYLRTMTDWGWNGLDVDWEVTVPSPTGAPVTVFKLRDDLDMAAVTAV